MFEFDKTISVYKHKNMQKLDYLFNELVYSNGKDSVLQKMK